MAGENHPPSLSDRLVANLEDLRLLLKEYHQLPDQDQKSVRHALYTKHGAFGKYAAKDVFPKFHTMETEYATKVAAQAAS
jgi:hypothetical protein